MNRPADSKPADIKGVGAVLTDDTGEVVASAFDFSRSGMGGCKLWEAQKWRARDSVYLDYISHYTYGPVAEVIKSYDASKIVQALCLNGKLKLTYIDIGYGEPEIWQR